MKEFIFQLLFLNMNSFTSIFSKIFNTDSDAKYKEQLFSRRVVFRTPFTSQHFLKTRGFTVEVNCRDFPLL